MKVRVFLSVWKVVNSLLHKNLQILKSAIKNKKKYIVCMHSNYTSELFLILWRKGFLKGVKKVQLKSRKEKSAKNFLVVFLHKYSLRSPLSSIEIISTSPRPVFLKWKNLVNFLQRNEIILLSTPFGLLDQKQSLILKTGGKVVCSIN